MENNTNIKYPDYNNCIVNLGNSILKEFGLKSKNNSLHLCDAELKNKYKNIVIIILDGMGKSVMEDNLDKDGFFNTNLKGTFSSVFPPTTVAATVSVISGLNPVEHSWLGWDCYYKDIDKNVTVFRNTESDTNVAAADFDVAMTYCPYEGIVEKINASRGQAYYVMSFREPYPEDFISISNRIEELCKRDGKKYIYSYWSEPDHIMHVTGCNSDDTKEVLRELENQVQSLCEKLDDTLVIVTADHGHINSDGVVITDYSNIMDCLVRMPSIEPRALNLYIKDGMKKKFESEFNKEFGDKFLLLTKEEVKKKKLFGIGNEHERFDDMLGDYIAVAVSDLSIYNTQKDKEKFVSVHAGLTKREMVIPFITIGLKMEKR